MLATIAVCAASNGAVVAADATHMPPPRHFASPAVAASCKNRVEETIASDAYDQTTSTTWVNLTDGLISYSTRRAGCALVTLSGASSAGGDFLLVQALLDGTTVCAPSGNINSQIFASGSTEDEAHSMTYLCTNVAAGSHTLQMQYESYAGGSVTFSGHTLVVAHN